MNIRERDNRLRNVLGIRNQSADANITGAVEIEDAVDTTSLSVDRSWTLPSGAFIGERCAVSISDDTGGFAIDILTPSGSTINGVDHTVTPFESIDTVGQIVEFVAVDDNGGVGAPVQWFSPGLGGAGGGLANVVEDTTPQLGGSLDVNSQKIVSVSNGNIDIEPNGTGNVLLGNFTFDADQTVGAGQDDYVLTYDNATGLISLEEAVAAGGGGGGGGITRKGARARPGSDLTTVDLSTGYLVPMNSEDFDIGGWHDTVTNNTRMTVPSDANDTVDIHIHFRASSVATSAVGRLQIYKDGAYYRTGSPLVENANVWESEMTILNDSCTPGTTYYELRVIGNDTSVTVETESSITVMESVQIISGNSSVTGVSRKGCRAKLSTALTAVNYTAPTAVPFDAEDFDIGGPWHDNVTNNTRVTVPADANDTVDITAFAYISSLNADAYALFQIYKDGVAYKRMGTETGLTNASGALTLLNESVVPGTTYYELVLLVETDTSVTIEATTSLTVMESIQTIGAVPAEALTVQISSADANVSATNGVHDEIDISGYSANRDYTLPTSSSIGNRYAVGVSAGNATYSVLVKTGVAGSLIDGVDCSSTEFTRLHITGEMVEFVCIDGSGPKYKAIPRLKAHKANIRLTAVSPSLSASTYTPWQTFDTNGSSEDWDIGGGMNATTGRYTVRRSGIYTITAYNRVNSNLLTGEKSIARVQKDPDGTPITVAKGAWSASANNGDGSPVTMPAILVAGDLLEFECWRTSAGTLYGSSTDLGTCTQWSIAEILP